MSHDTQFDPKKQKKEHRGVKQDFDVANNPHSLLIEATVCQMTGLRPSTIRKKRRMGTFPKPVNGRPLRWVCKTITDWVDAQGGGN